MPDSKDSWAQTRDINLASALASFSEVEFADEMPVAKFQDHEKNQEFSVFRFKVSSKVEEVMRLWDSPDLMTAHPEHPVAYMKAYMHNRNRLLDVVKQGNVWHMVKKAGRIYFVNKGASNG